MGELLLVKTHPATPKAATLSKFSVRMAAAKAGEARKAKTTSIVIARSCFIGFSFIRKFPCGCARTLDDTRGRQGGLGARRRSFSAARPRIASENEGREGEAAHRRRG